MFIAEGLCPCALLSVYLNDDKCQGFLLGLVFFHSRGDTFPLSLTFSPKSWYNLFLLEGKYQSCSRPKAIFFESCLGCDCRYSDKEEIVAEMGARAGKGYCLHSSLCLELQAKPRERQWCQHYLQAQGPLPDNVGNPTHSHLPQQEHSCSYFLTSLD